MQQLVPNKKRRENEKNVNVTREERWGTCMKGRGTCMKGWGTCMKGCGTCMKGRETCMKGWGMSMVQKIRSGGLRAKMGFKKWKRYIFSNFLFCITGQI